MGNSQDLVLVRCVVPLTTLPPSRGTCRVKIEGLEYGKFYECLRVKVKGFGFSERESDSFLGKSGMLKPET